MKTVFDPEDIEAIARRTVDLLRPLLAGRTGTKEEDTLFTVDTLAEYLHVPKSWVYNAVHLKQIPYKKQGKWYTQFRKSEIDKWLEEKAVKPE